MNAGRCCCFIYKRKADAINFCMRVGGCVFFKGLKGLVKYRTSHILKYSLCLMKYRIMLIRNTVEMAGG